MQLGYGPEDQEKGKATRGQLKWDAVLADTQAAYEAAKPAGKVAIIGCCFGGLIGPHRVVQVEC
jgi:dienelactone hydrolase